MDYSINYDDERFKQIEVEKQNAINQSNQMYDNMINQSEKFYQDQINANNDYLQKQNELQQQRTDLAIEKIENDKAQIQKDYEREQRGAYQDYQETINPYGANAEAMASNGIAQNSGVSESARIASWSAYQNRYSTAKQTYEKAVVDYNLAIKDAQLQNNAALAEIAFNTLQANLQLGLDSFQYKNSLLTDQLNRQQQLDTEYYGRWQDVLGQINQENTLAEQIRQYEKDFAEKQRQYNEQMAYQKERDKVADAQWQKEYNLAVSNAKKSSSGGSGGGGGSKNNNYQYSDKDLSKYAKNLLAELKASIPAETSDGWLKKTTNNVAIATKKTLATNRIKKEYNNGKLTDAEVTYLVSTLGL